MSIYAVADDDRATIQRAATILAARHNSCEVVATILAAQMEEVALHTPSTGGHGYVQWCAAMQTFGEIVTALAKQEARKAKDMNYGSR